MPGRTRSFAEPTATSHPYLTAPTAREAYSHLAEAGITGPLADRLVRDGAHHRHGQRVDVVRAVALAIAPDLAHDAWAARLTTTALCAIERMSERHPASRGATDRLPIFRDLGKGRRNADDGPAWDAAIGEAGSLGIIITPTSDPEWVQVTTPGQRPTREPSQTHEIELRLGGSAVPAGFAASFAAQCARVLLCSSDHSTPKIGGDAADWSAVFERHNPLDGALRIWLYAALRELRERITELGVGSFELSLVAAARTPDTRADLLALRAVVDAAVEGVMLGDPPATIWQWRKHLETLYPDVAPEIRREAQYEDAPFADTEEERHVVEGLHKLLEALRHQEACDRLCAGWRPRWAGDAMLSRRYGTVPEPRDDRPQVRWTPQPAEPVAGLPEWERELLDVVGRVE